MSGLDPPWSRHLAMSVTSAKVWILIHKAADLTQPAAWVDGSLKLPWFSYEAKVLFDLGMMQGGFKAKSTSCLHYQQ
jgi:hypothetical protein